MCNVFFSLIYMFPDENKSFISVFCNLLRV